MNAAKFYQLVDEKGYSIQAISKIIGKSEVTTLRKIVSGGFKQSEIALLKNELNLSDEETADIFLN